MGILKIGQVAREAGVSVDTVRFYEQCGVLPIPDRLASGYRTYTPTTVYRILLARRLQALGLKLTEVVAAMAAISAGTVDESDRAQFANVLDRIDAQIADLQATKAEVQRVLAACATGHCDFESLVSQVREN